MTEADIHTFLADYLERKLSLRMEEEARPDGHAQYATDSGN